MGGGFSIPSNNIYGNKDGAREISLPHEFEQI